MAIRFREDRQQYVVIVNVNGKRIKRQAKTKKLAEKLERELLSQDRTGESIDIYEAAKEYLQTVSVKKAQKNNERRYLSLMVQYFDALKIKNVNEIKYRNMEGLQTWLLKKHGLKGSTVDRYFSTYKHFFKWCVQNEFNDKIPTQGLEQIGEPIEKRPMSSEEFQALYDASPDWLQTPLKFMWLTGMRPSSFCGIKRGDVDFVEKRITYWSRKGYGKPTKKVIAMSPDLEELLKSMFLDGVPWIPSSPLFLNKSGRPLTASHFADSAGKYRRKANVEVRTYRIRDAFATDLVKAGIPAGRARQLTGHASEAMFEKYVGAMPTKTLIEDMKCLEKRRLESKQHETQDGAKVAQIGGARHL